MIMTAKLILASSSRYRRELLDRLGVPYTCESPDIDETGIPGETPQDAAMRLAEAKARKVWEAHPGSVVIGSDQVADLAGVRLGKPHNRENAIRKLREMQGREVVFTTALCVIDAQGRAERVKSQTFIRMRRLSNRAIEAYVDREQPFDCAGSAKIEKLGIPLMESVRSDDPTSLIGLPLMALTTLLTRAGVEVLPGLEA
jgi:septum formation protein